MARSRLSKFKADDNGYATIVTISNKIPSTTLRPLVSEFNTKSSGVLNRMYRSGSSTWTGTRGNVLYICRTALEYNVNKRPATEIIRDKKQRCYLAVTRFIERHIKFEPTTQTFKLVTAEGWEAFKSKHEEIEINSILGFTRRPQLKDAFKGVPKIPELLLDLYSEHFHMTTQEIDRQVDLLLREHGHNSPKPQNRIHRNEPPKAMTKEPDNISEKLRVDAISADGNLRKLNALIEFTANNPRLAEKVLDKSIEFTKQVIQEQLTKLKELENEIE